MNNIILLRLASLAYLGLLTAGLLLPRVVGLRRHLEPLPSFIRQLFWTYYAFIGLCLVSFGLVTFVFAESLAGGSDLARAICGFLAVFWALRLAAGTFVFDLDPYLTNVWRRLGLRAANLTFGALPLIYAWVAWKGGPP